MTDSTRAGRWVLHADMDAFYASIEELDDPSLRGLPVIVGATSARGVVAAASYEARRFGVRSAMPGFRARELCPHGVFLRPRMSRYGQASRQVHAVLEEFSSVIEPLALDEAFLEITGSVGLFGGPLATARELRRRVRERTGLAVSVGVAPSKLVAKIACSFGKPNGCLVVPREAVRWLLDPLPVRRLWGVGPVLGAALEALGIRTIGELARAEPSRLSSVVGDRTSTLQELARGQDVRPVVAERIPKSYGEESTFEHDVTDPEVVLAALAAHAEAVARRVRHDGYAGATVTIKVKLGRRKQYRPGRAERANEPVYPLLTRRTTLRVPTDDGAVIRRAACSLWDRARVGEPVRLLGVALSNLAPARSRQLDLFERPAKTKVLAPTLDEIQRRFGEGAIRHGASAPEKVTPSLHRKRGV
jgi:DNA polymerase-4